MRTTRLFTLAVIVLLALSALASASVPPMINYQGKLMQPSGVNVPDGPKIMTFAIYAQATGGTALWSEPNVSIQVKGGLFNVLLGSPTPFTAGLFDGADRWFGVTVGTDPEMSPRQQIASVPYAQIAGNGTPVGGIIMWSGSIAGIPAGWALCDGTNGTPDLQDRFIVGAGPSNAIGATGGVASIDLAHTHTVTAHNHTISAEAPGTNTAGAHSHGIAYSNIGGDSAKNGGDMMGHYTCDSQGSHSHTVSSHSHGGATGSASPATTSALSIVDNRPPYYALCFIMKLAY